MPSARETKEKSRLHPRNRNRERYDLKALQTAIPELGKYIKPNKFGMDSIDFSDPIAVKLLNQALLKHYYGIDNWNFPKGNLCPPIPGRADYLHHIADLLSENNEGKIPSGDKITCFDIGLGANCIYPIIGVVEYAWNFIGSDVDSKSIASAINIIQSNAVLKNKIDCRLQKEAKAIFSGIIAQNEKIDVSICNPPFHSSAEEAQKGIRRKVRKLSGKREKKPKLNFGGISSELIFEGGEYQFIQNMIQESKKFSNNFYWFSSLVSKKENLKGIYQSLDKIEANQVKTIPMGTENKVSRIVAWTFLSKNEQKEWREIRWNSD